MRRAAGGGEPAPPSRSLPSSRPCSGRHGALLGAPGTPALSSHAVLPSVLQVLGFEIDAVNSVQFSNHTGKASVPSRGTAEHRWVAWAPGHQGATLLWTGAPKCHPAQSLHSTRGRSWGLPHPDVCGFASRLAAPELRDLEQVAGPLCASVSSENRVVIKAQPGDRVSWVSPSAGGCPARNTVLPAGCLLTPCPPVGALGVRSPMQSFQGGLQAVWASHTSAKGRERVLMGTPGTWLPEH